MISKMKVVYISIIIGLTIFIVANVKSFIPPERLKFVNSIHLWGNQNVHIIEKNENIIEQPSSGESKKKKAKSFRHHDTPQVLKIIDEDKNARTFDNEIGGGENDLLIIEKSHEGTSLNASSAEAKKGTIASSTSGGKSEKSSLGLCAKRGEKLVGPLFVDQEIPDENEEKGLSVEFGGTVEKGGWWAPTNCQPRVKVAIIIPYRKREKQLRIFLKHMHPFLQRQRLYYRIIVVEQLKDSPFNRAALFNVGFVEALKMSPFDCFVFSDVDLLPEDDRNYYGCPTSPRHMSVAVDKFNYKLPYATIFGGVGAFTKDHFEQINGMSNLFWGWGGEDDDLYQRISEEGFKLTRPSMLVGRYTMIKLQHFVSSKADPNRMNLLRNSKERMVVDGLSTLKYSLQAIVEKPLVTFVQVEMNKGDYFQ